MNLTVFEELWIGGMKRTWLRKDFGWTLRVLFEVLRILLRFEGFMSFMGFCFIIYTMETHILGTSQEDISGGFT